MTLHVWDLVLILFIFGVFFWGLYCGDYLAKEKSSRR